jgi:hypothetical protein
MTRQRLFLGDWGGPLRDPIDLIRATYLIGALGMVVAGEIGGAVRLALTAALVIAVRQLDLPRPLDLAFVLGMGLQGWGNAFNAYDDLAWYDTVVHFLLPALFSPVLYVALERIDVLPKLAERGRRHQYVGIFLITFALGLAFGGALYELYEYAADQLLGTDLSKGYTDTITDLFADTCGAALGGALLVVWAEFGWATDRRLPAELLQRG